MKAKYTQNDGSQWDKKRMKKKNKSLSFGATLVELHKSLSSSSLYTQFLCFFFRNQK